MSKYRVKFWRDNPETEPPDYLITVDADDPEEAAEKATNFLLENAWWSGLMTDKEKRKQLGRYVVEVW